MDGVKPKPGGREERPRVVAWLSSARVVNVEFSPQQAQPPAPCYSIRLELMRGYQSAGK